MPTPLSAIPLPNHLGGHCHKTHTDYGVLRHFLSHCQIKSFLDIGCGPGGMVDMAAKAGLRAFGIDGDFTLPQFTDPSYQLDCTFIKHDFTTGPFDERCCSDLYADISAPTPIDLVWSVEFLEHIEAQYLLDVMPLFTLGKWAVVTAAPPGAAGHHHVNCQPVSYWVELFQSYGFRYDQEFTESIRRESTMKRSFIRDTGLVFRNER